MKFKKYGLSATSCNQGSRMHPIGGGKYQRVNIPLLAMNPINFKEQCQSAVQSYKVDRENGDEKDNPSQPFPNDGRYDWETPNASTSCIRYTQGEADAAWMTEKDKNYLRRLGYDEKNYSSELKTQKYGLSNSLVYQNVTLDRRFPEHPASARRYIRHPFPSPSTCKGLIAEAIKDYRDMRENGSEFDSPDRPFPNDGECSWEKPDDPGGSRLLYKEGKKDAAWMAEKDQKYLRRFEHKVEESVQQCSSSTVSISSSSALSTAYKS